MRAPSLRSIEEIPGWFWAPDVTMFEWFLTQQVHTGQVGDLAELGPYMGKSAVLIGGHRQPGEVFTVVDLFEDAAPDQANAAENAGTYQGLSQAAFESSYRRFHGELPVVIKGPSQSVADHARRGTHRWVHIDASHLYDHVRGDIRAAKALMAKGGVVAFDDIRATHAPGVWAAVWEEVINGSLKPIVVSEHKMYATWDEATSWQDRLLASPPAGMLLEEQSVLGSRLLRVEFAAGPPIRPSRRAVVALTPPALLHRLDRLRHRSER